jgi:predicted RNase H-like nuclease
MEAGDGSAVVAVDAPLVIRNRTGIRDSECAMNQEFRRFYAGRHAANLGRPFAQKVLSFSQKLSDLASATARR